jgi:hypothetical protein
MINFKVMEKNLSKMNKDELFDELVKNYQIHVKILEDTIKDRDKFIAILERQLTNIDKHIDRLYDEIRSKSSE